MKIVMVAREGGHEARPIKTVNSLCALGHDVTFIGWERRPDQVKAPPFDARVRCYLFRHPAGFGDYSLAGFPQFVSSIGRILAQVRPDVVHARDEPLAALVLPFKHVYYRYLVLDIYDSLRRVHLRQPLQLFANTIRRLSHRFSDRIIETSKELTAFLSPGAQAKTTVIMNVPPDPGEQLARDFPTSDAIQLCTGGSLMRHRDALEALLQVIDSLPPGTVQIQASGWFHDDYARDVFARHPAVTYRKFDTPDEFRAVAARCDALTYLDGFASDVSVYRSRVLPNRLFDALSVGRPLIVSRRLEISKWIERDQLGYVCEPGDAAGLRQTILALKDQRDQLPDFAARVRQIFVSQYTWPHMEQRLAAVYDSLGRRA
jgi:glycosyltransferase involved in cell wall biosynthesis